MIKQGDHVQLTAEQQAIEPVTCTVVALEDEDDRGKVLLQFQYPEFTNFMFPTRVEYAKYWEVVKN